MDIAPSDVAQLTALLDDAVGELRVAAGLPRVDLTLVATASPLPPVVPELPPPTLRESIEQAFRAASVTDDPAERVSLLEAIVASLGGAEAGKRERERAGRALLHARASAALRQELKIDRSYRDLVSRVVTHGRRAARRADVNGIEKLVAAVLKADDRLGRRRPQTTAALAGDARRRGSTRRAACGWRAMPGRCGAMRSYDYQRRIRAAINRLRRSSPGLEQIRQLSGPAPDALTPLAARVTDAWKETEERSGRQPKPRPCTTCSSARCSWRFAPPRRAGWRLPAPT